MKRTLARAGVLVATGALVAVFSALPASAHVVADPDTAPQGGPPRTITWTSAPGTRINPGEFIDFDVSMGPLPTNVDQLVMPATQTYDDGTVVAWDAPPAPAGQPEPEHPAPVLTLTPAPAGGTSGMNAAAPEPANTSAADTTARWLGGIALALAVIGLAIALAVALRSRRAGRP
jgi:hypothetical protein